MVGFWNGQKTKFMKIQLSPGGPYLQVLVFFGHESYIEALYGSWNTQRCKKEANKPLELELQGDGYNRSLAVLTSLPVYFTCMYSGNICYEQNDY